MTQFHEGQEVEVQYDDGEGGPRDIIWRKAKIIREDRAPDYQGWFVQFPDGSRTVVDAEHIRAVSP